MKTCEILHVVNLTRSNVSLSRQTSYEGEERVATRERERERDNEYHGVKCQES